ncbi:DJ-1/PfpI family protein [Vibrio algivorus]|uniref:Glutamine amidotransferase n=1 Tax=Vibrio algivorus TaxID=1667024 RepID=A0ABQ6EKN5_9VIBR|nr:DJ-1/PfpI family protein [Vibrio algivorus]GLT13687.1 glutamine amidotransferase [Vibrio algivorus]
MNIGIYIYDNAEVLDFSGPYEVFTTANRVCSPSPFNAFLIAENLQPVKARSGFNVLPHYDISNHPKLDTLIVVGGDHTQEINNELAIDWISKQGQTVPLITSVCTGAFLLAKAGILQTHKATTHWEDIADLRQQFPLLEVLENVRWVQDGNRISSGGISAGIDMSLFIVSELTSIETAEATAKQMEFRWQRN